MLHVAATSQGAGMAGFVQIVQFTTSRIEEVEALAEAMRAQREAGTVRRGTFTSDRDRPNHYLSVIEFDSYDSAMENSNRPETAEFSAKMAALCDGPPTFYNLDVMRTWPE
jgi:quinol monooxygenase YgiN